MLVLDKVLTLMSTSLYPLIETLKLLVYTKSPLCAVQKQKKQLIWLKIYRVVLEFKIAKFLSRYTETLKVLCCTILPRAKNNPLVCLIFCTS